MNDHATADDVCRTTSDREAGQGRRQTGITRCIRRQLRHVAGVVIGMIGMPVCLPVGLKWPPALVASGAEQSPFS